MTKYKCAICGLHYKSRRLAAERHKWRSAHDGCNLSVARHSIKASKKR